MCYYKYIFIIMLAIVQVFILSSCSKTDLPDEVTNNNINIQSDEETDTENIEEKIKNGPWVYKAEMLIGKRFPAVVTLNNKIYVIGGQGSNKENLNTLEVYDPEADEWVTKAPMTVLNGRVNGACAAEGKIYVFGMWNSSNKQNAVEEYNPETDQWTVVSELPTQRIVAAATNSDGKIYLVGGQGNQSESLSTAEVYDPAANSWSAVTDMKVSRGYLAAETLNNFIYAIGGKSTDGNADNIEMYDPLKDSWIKKAQMPIKGAEVSTAVIGDVIYAGGGMSSVLIKYDSQTDKWSPVLNTPVIPSYCGIASVNNKLYVIGGENGCNTVLEYSPDLDK